jgi:hypothetical protein
VHIAATTAAATNPLAADDKSVADDEPHAAALAGSHLWVYLIAALLVLVVIIAFAMAARGGAEPRRLSMAEREDALLRLRQWIESSGVER